MRGLIVLAATLLLYPAIARADVVSERPDKFAVTLYHSEATSMDDLRGEDAAYLRQDGIAFIAEERTLDLPAGPSIIHFRGVASTMVPQSANVEGLPEPVAEQNFDYDLLSPATLLAKSIGRTVTLVRTDPKTGAETSRAAIVRSGPNGAVLEINGKVEALNCAGLHERLVFDDLPEGLTDTPTLSLRVTLPSAGRYTVKLSYIATGLYWSANYVGRVGPDGKTLDLSGWITLANFGTTGFPQIPLSVVAGNLNTTGEDEPINAPRLYRSDSCWPMNIDWAKHLRRDVAQFAPSLPPPAPPPPSNAIESVVVTAEKRSSIDAQQLGDYKLYPLPEPTTMAAMQTKQVQFVDRPAVPFEKIYTYILDTDETDTAAASVLYRITNTHENGLGVPLPAGALAVQTPGPDGDPLFVGSGAVRDTPPGLPVDVTTGRAIDVEVSHRITRDHRDSAHHRVTKTILIANAKPVPIVFEYYDGYDPAAKILSETKSHVLKYNAPMWSFTIPPGETATLEYTTESPND